MKIKVILSITALTILFFPFNSWGQVRVTTERVVENQELLDFFRFEGIQYMKMNFTGNELKDKIYRISVKEIWNGIITKDSVIIDSKRLNITVGDTILKMRVISKLTEENKLKMNFIFPRFTTTIQFDAVSSDAYSLRNVLGRETEMLVDFGEKFYVLVYMLPYEVKTEIGTWFQYCAVEISGKEIETWGKEFGIEHYLVFEMIFE